MVNGLGKRLEQARVNLHLSQKEAAAAIGASASVISNYESGERTPSVENLMALASLYSCRTSFGDWAVRQSSLFRPSFLFLPHICGQFFLYAF